MKKPKPQVRKVLDWTACTTYIERKYNINTRDYGHRHAQFGEWCASKGLKPIDSRKDITGSQRQWAEYQAAIKAGEVTERLYLDFWHWLLDVADVHRGGTIELSADMGDGADQWQKDILALYLKEFGSGPYLTDW